MNRRERDAVAWLAADAAVIRTQTELAKLGQPLLTAYAGETLRMAVHDTVLKTTRKMMKEGRP